MKFAALLAFLITGSALATELNFKCDFTNETYVHQFSLEAKKIVLDDEGKFSNVEFDFTLRRAGRDVQKERLVVTRDGHGTIFPAGTMYNRETARIASVIKGAEVEYINILIDMGPAYSSEIRFNNQMTYRGSCKSL